METLRHHVIQHRMIKRNKRLALTMVMTAGTLCSYTHFRNNFLSRGGGGNHGNQTADADEKNWFTSFVAKRFKTMKPTLPEQIMNSMLRYNEYTKKLGGSNTQKPGVTGSTQKPGVIASFETNHFRANNPLEDRHCECYLKQDGSYLFGVFDGHSGWYCSESLRTRLPTYITLALMSKEQRDSYLSENLKSNDILEYVGKQSEDELENEEILGFEEKQRKFRTGLKFYLEELKNIDENISESVSELLKYSYLTMDKDITVEAIPDGICNDPIWNGLSGAVAVTAYIKENNIYISNTGDCRAVMGKKSSSGQWIDVTLSSDHNCDNITEVKRLKSEHPKEKMVVYQERLLGQLQPLRSFGDVPYKWSRELHENVLDVIYGHPSVPRSIYLTPPYLTAEPEVTVTTIDSSSKFLILATDGLWDFVSTGKAVKIIGAYLDEFENNCQPEENGCTKLIRYALGKGSNNKLANMLRIPENLKRNYHDDITVTVIYFDDVSSVQSRL